MITALPLQSASLSAAAPNPVLANTSHLNYPVNPTQVDSTAAHQATNPQQLDLPNDVEAFYTVGHNLQDVGCQPSNMNTPNMVNFHNTGASHSYLENAADGSLQSSDSLQANNADSNLFTNSMNLLQKSGGPNDPLALFKLQQDTIAATLNWSLYGQMASKAVSGIQSLFNNQV